MIAPTVHMNGSGRASLFEQHRAMLDALKKASEALSGGFPHGRDYYVQDGDGTAGEANSRARREMQTRITIVRQMEEEIRAIMINIYDQPK